MEIFKDYINFFKTGDPRETDRSYWMFSYDHKSTKKEDFKPDSKKVLRKEDFETLNYALYRCFIDILFRIAGYPNIDNPYRKSD